ncbi:hypothetical protein F2Q69_00048194 [Brassica cretica]|uniref:Uncharacterized protein n=1 Tax=Brassica cretica TaxID=69181 RepID=A0A8S9PIR7_BRACR|nr:hypothetical protein F2Q69_00048194 [Brassica cretica]
MMLSQSFDKQKPHQMTEQSSCGHVRQEVVTVRDRLEKKEQDPGFSSLSKRRRSQRFTPKNKIDKLTRT